MSSLLIVGAGPKALAIAAKNTLLAELGHDVPEIHILEKNEIAAHWAGRAGFTNGQLELGTSPEKDIGFPYNSQAFDSETNHRLNGEMLRFSWANYLVQTQKYSEWIDRQRPAPTHAEWASYLRWVATQLGPSIHLHSGTLTQLKVHNSQWSVQFTQSDAQRELTVDGVVMTGPGRQRLDFEVPRHPGILSLHSFWSQLDQLKNFKGRIAIVGNGENASSMALSLLHGAPSDLQVDVISPMGFISSRGESYYENRYYSDPRGWQKINLSHRGEFIRRTDLGVFSQSTMQELNQARALQVIPGRVQNVHIDAEENICATVQYGADVQTLQYTALALATGFDQAQFIADFLDPESLQTISDQAHLPSFTSADIAQRIGPALDVEGTSPRLHLPMLSGLRQGPGFANLSSLGHLSDRILSPYLNGGPSE